MYYLIRGLSAFLDVRDYYAIRDRSLNYRYKFVRKLDTDTRTRTWPEVDECVLRVWVNFETDNAIRGRFTRRRLTPVTIQSVFRLSFSSGSQYFVLTLTDNLIDYDYCRSTLMDVQYQRALPDNRVGESGERDYRMSYVAGRRCVRASLFFFFFFFCVVLECNRVYVFTCASLFTPVGSHSEILEKETRGDWFIIGDRVFK